MKVALTGATGFVGKRIVEALTLAGHDVQCLVRPGRASALSDAPKVTLVNGDLSDPASLQELVQHCDAVVHNGVFHEGQMDQVGREAPHEHFERNVFSSLRLLELAREHGQQFVFISSGAVFGDPPGRAPLTDDFARSPVSSYGAYKASVEMFCQAYAHQFGVNACVLRPFRILGVHSNVTESPFYDVIECVLQGDVLQLSKGSKAVLVEDVARAVAFVLGREDVKGQTYNLCDGYVSQQQVAQIAIEEASSKSKLDKITQHEPRHEAISEGIKALGFTFGGPDGLRRCVRDLLGAAQEHAPAA